MNGLEWILLIVLSLLWGASFFFAEIALAEIPAFTLAFCRVLLAALILAMAAIAFGHRIPRSPRAWRRYAVLGLMSNALPFCFIYSGQAHITGGHASILNATTPFFTILLAHFFTADEKFSLRKTAGAGLGLGGVITVIGTQGLAGTGDTLLPQLAVLSGAFCYGVAGVYGKRFTGEPLLVTSSCQLSVSALMLLPVMLYFDRHKLPAMPSPEVIAAVFAVAALSTALAYLVYFRILRTAGATNVVLVTLLAPVSAILLGVIVLGESLEARHLAGFAVITVGLAVIDGRLFRLAVNRAKRAW